MAKSKTSFQPGQSGNPQGRPLKNRALTELLLAAGNVKVSDGNGGQIQRKKLLADMLWKLAVTGQVTFHGTNREWGDTKTFEFRDVGAWQETARWLFEQIDGGLSIRINYKGDIEGDVASAAPGPVDGIPGPQLYLPDNGRGDRSLSDGKEETDPGSDTS